ncbi:phosphonatase-like hydrolase [Gillisia sp. Hel_I_86]|uniref:phosphonatase-like hydrolase n=1 Tax=Gillisia sp. Hel_I_86 TaxID=1249981 RepID=UPI001198E01E|nr:phosphonatase-like hydrolase [Gillisia sp. Hel_I_86]TVZ25856.1 phosphonatase-like hydrolase [Gillisia sp. Hel_I_86]
MNKFKMGVFDMAGTTVDEKNLVYKTLEEAISEYGYQVNLSFVLVHGAGKEKHQAIKDILKALNIKANLDRETDKIYEKFKHKLDMVYRHIEVRPFDGALEVFRSLRKDGVKIVLNTGYDRETAEYLLSGLNWQIGVDFDLLVTADEVKNGRPAPDMILLAMKEFVIDDAGMVFKIGDSSVDIEEGKNAGCGLTFGITTGAQNKDQLKQALPDYIIQTLKELPKILLERSV